MLKGQILLKQGFLYPVCSAQIYVFEWKKNIQISKSTTSFCSDNTKEEFASSSDDYLSDRADVVFSGDTAPSQVKDWNIFFKSFCRI